MHALERPRLLEVLDRGHPLTVVCGPAGGGKSVLLMQWGRAQAESGVAVIRVAFDETTANEHLMLRDIYAQLLSLDLTPDRDNATAMLRGFDSVRDRADVVADVLASVERPCVILIDNADRVDELDLLTRLREIVEAAPAVRIVVATRRSLTVKALELLASTDAGVVGAAQLLFTPQEAQAVIERTSGQTVPIDELGDASSLPLSARLLGLAHISPVMARDLANSEREQAAEALMATLISTTVSAEFRDFLLHSAVPGGVTHEIAARLGWRDDAARHLDRAEAYGLGVWESGDDGPAFVYTPALREALLRRLAQKPRDLVVRIRRIVAISAFEHGRYLEALSNALDANDYDLASRIGRKGWFILSRTCPEDFERLLRRQPAGVLLRHPTLSVIMALCLSQLGHRVRAFGYFQAAALAMHGRTPDDDLVERFWELATRSTAERFAGFYQRASRTADLAEETYERMTVDQRNGCDGATALLLSTCGLSYLFVGRYADAVRILEQGMAMRVADSVTILENGVRLRLPNDDGGWFHCASTLAATHALRGRLAEARRVLQEIDAFDPPRAWHVDLYGIMEQVARAIVAVGELDPERAWEHTKSVSHHLGESELWPYIVLAQSSAEMLDHRPADALLTVTRAVEPGVNSVMSEHGEERLVVARSAALMSLGSRASAERALRGLAPDSPERRVLEGFIALRSDEPANAIARVEGGEGVHIEDLHYRAVGMLLVAVAAERLGRVATVSTETALACAIMKEQQNRAPLMFFARDELLAIRAVADRASAEILDEYLASGWDRSPFPALTPTVVLTSRELAVMRELRRTASTSAIADALFVSPNTVKVQRRSAYRKLGAATREQALLRAAELGILDDEETTHGDDSRRR